MISESRGLPRIHESYRTKESKGVGNTGKGSRSKYGKLSSKMEMPLRYEKESKSLAPAKDLLRYIRQSRKYKDLYTQNLDFEDTDMKKLIFCSENQPQRYVKEEKKHQECEQESHKESFLPDIVTSTTKGSHQRVFPNHKTYVTNNDDTTTKTRSRTNDLEHPCHHYNYQSSPKLPSPRQHIRINFPMPTTPRRGRVDHVWPEGHRYHVRLRFGEKHGDVNE